MNRRQFIETSALAASVACLGMRHPSYAAEDNSNAGQPTSTTDSTVGVGKPSSLEWHRIGPDFKPTEGICYQVLPHPQRSGELLAGTRPQGLLLSTDHGRTWRRTSEKFPENGDVGPNPASMARAPSQPDTVYVGIETLGVRRSDDGGRNWRDLSATLPKGSARNGVSAAVHPTDPETVWLGTDGGIFKTNDGGRNWRRLKQGLPTGKVKNSNEVNQTITAIFVDAKRPERVWLGMYASGYNEPAGVWRSEDGGNTWRQSSANIDSGDQVNGSITARRDWVMGFARSSSEPDVFFVTTPFAVYRSADGAKTWQKLPRSIGGDAVAVHPRDANHIFHADREGRVEHSTDGGNTWRDISAGLRLGREPNSPVYRFNFTGPDGKTEVVEGTNRRFQNQVISFAFDPLDSCILYACAHAGLYQVRLRPS